MDNLQILLLTLVNNVMLLVQHVVEQMITNVDHVAQDHSLKIINVLKLAQKENTEILT